MLRLRGGTLIDAGPLVALLHADDNDHARCVSALKDLRGPLYSTWMPVTEAMYLLNFSSNAQSALLQMLERQAVRILPIAPGDLAAIRASMIKYRDLPMDFADASLVHVAEREGCNRIFTLDARDFSVYRLSANKTFELIPGL